MSSDPRRPYSAAVTGIGLVTPAGVGVEQNWRTLCSGVSAARKDPALAGLPVDFSCRVPDFDAGELLGRTKALRIARFIQMAIVAAREAVRTADLDPKTWEGSRIGLVIGNSLGGTEVLERQFQEFDEQGEDMVSPFTIPATMGNMVAGYLAMELNITGPSFVAATACASGTTAIGLARELLRSGQCDIVVAGGSESALSAKTITALNRMSALSRDVDNPAAASRPFDVTRNGFVAGEAAGILVLENGADAGRDGRARAYISGYGSASDAHHPTAPHPDGRGIESAITGALRDSGLSPKDIAHVNAHGTSTQLNDATEATALARTLGTHPVITSTKGVTGHPLAAAGAIEAAYTVLAIENRLVPPTANLTEVDPKVTLRVAKETPLPLDIDAAMSTSLGFGGHNAALVITAEAA